MPFVPKIRERPLTTSSGSRARVSGVRAVFVAMAVMPASLISACGRNWRRTAERVPSAATRTSPVAVVPSVKWAVTVPSGCCS